MKIVWIKDSRLPLEKPDTYEDFLMKMYWQQDLRQNLDVPIFNEVDIGRCSELEYQFFLQTLAEPIDISGGCVKLMVCELSSHSRAFIERLSNLRAFAEDPLMEILIWDKSGIEKDDDFTKLLVREGFYHNTFPSSLVRAEGEMLQALLYSRLVQKKFQLNAYLNAVGVTRDYRLGKEKLFAPSVNTVFKVGKVIFNTESMLAMENDLEVNLPKTQLDLLLFLIKNQSKALDKVDIKRILWGRDDELPTNKVEVAVSRLRKIIEPDPEHPRYLVTVRGFGYRLDLDPATRSAKS